MVFVGQSGAKVKVVRQVKGGNRMVGEMAGGVACRGARSVCSNYNGAAE